MVSGKVEKVFRSTLVKFLSEISEQEQAKRGQTENMVYLRKEE